MLGLEEDMEDDIHERVTREIVQASNVASDEEDDDFDNPMYADADDTKGSKKQPAATDDPTSGGAPAKKKKEKKKKKKKKAKKDVAGTDPTAEFDFPDEDPTAGDFDIE